MMNRLPFAAIMGLIILSTGCTLAEIYGDKCPDWDDLYVNGKPLDQNASSFAQDAKEAGYCPENYICSVNSNKQNICIAQCDQNKCINGCNEIGACKCDDKCINGCDETGACKCNDDCENGCDELGQCKCDEECTEGCDEFGHCKCDCAHGCDSKGNCICPKDCTTSCDVKGKCQCNTQCPSVCNSNGECICVNDDASCINSNAINECFENKWVQRTCPVGCQTGSEKNRDACIPFVCDENSVRCNPDNPKIVQTCQNNAWKDNTEECSFGCDEGKCLSAESILVSTNTVWLLNNDNPAENSKSVNAKYIINTVVTPVEFVIQPSTLNCILVAPQNQDNNSTQLSISIYPGVDSCKTTLTLKAGEATQSIEVRVFGANEDINGNHLLDYYETASKQGKDCKKYNECDSTDGKETGFCDSFIGYKCSTKCTNDKQCVPDETIDGNTFHYICRGDGRCAPDTFETVWEVPDNNKTITLPTHYAKNCNFHLDWGDGQTADYSSCPNPDINHTYSQAGTYHVKITGSYDNWALSNNKYALNPLCNNFKGVISFGPVGLAGKDYFVFFRCPQNSIMPTVDIPDSTKLTNMAYMFLGNTEFDQPIGNWDTSNVTNMSHIFDNANVFNQPIGNWMTSNVTNLNYAFNNATTFNQDLDGWDTSNVTTMKNVFYNATHFNGKLNSWNTSSVKYMDHMFDNATDFNQPLNNWKTFNVIDMSEMFYYATSFNQDLDKWDVSNVESMNYTFYYAISFNGKLNTWNTSSVKYMKHMFDNAISFNQPIDSWDMSNVEILDYMFYYATSFNQDLNNWKLNKLSTATNLFAYATSFNGQISNWNTSTITDMEHMFYGATNFNQPLNNWDTSNVLDISWMFENATSFDQPLDKWDVSKVNSPEFKDVFYNSGLSKENYCKLFNGNYASYWLARKNILGKSFDCP